MKFNFKKVVRIAFADEFTTIATQLFILAAMVQGLDWTIMVTLFGGRDGPSLLGLYNSIFLYTIGFFYLFTFIAEYNLINSNIDVDIKAGIRFIGFLSIFILIQGVIGILYEYYAFLIVGGSRGFDYWSLYQFYSLLILGLIIAVYLVKYTSLRLGVTSGITILIILVSSTLTSMILGVLAPGIFEFLLSNRPLNDIVNIALATGSVVALIRLQVKK